LSVELHSGFPWQKQHSTRFSFTITEQKPSVVLKIENFEKVDHNAWKLRGRRMKKIIWLIVCKTKQCHIESNMQG